MTLTHNKTFSKFKLLVKNGSTIEHFTKCFQIVKNPLFLVKCMTIG